MPNAAAHPTKMGLNPPAHPTKVGLNPGLPGYGHCGVKSGCGSYQYGAKSGCGSYQYGAKSASDNCGDKSGTLHYVYIYEPNHIGFQTVNAEPELVCHVTGLVQMEAGQFDSEHSFGSEAALDEERTDSLLSYLQCKNQKRREGCTSSCHCGWPNDGSARPRHRKAKQMRKEKI